MASPWPADPTSLCCDIILMAEDARIGYMPARVWGCPTTAMWLYRLGPEKAKRMLFTGDKIDGREAEKLGLVLKAVPADQLDREVDALARRIGSVPQNQLMMQKLMLNGALTNMGLQSTQMMATLFDGIAPHAGRAQLQASRSRSGVEAGGGGA
jgi:enoyl-CoA hydratase